MAKHHWHSLLHGKRSKSTSGLTESTPILLYPTWLYFIIQPRNGWPRPPRALYAIAIWNFWIFAEELNRFSTALRNIYRTTYHSKASNNEVLNFTIYLFFYKIQMQIVLAADFVSTASVGEGAHNHVQSQLLIATLLIYWFVFSWPSTFFRFLISHLTLSYTTSSSNQE